MKVESFESKSVKKIFTTAIVPIGLCVLLLSSYYYKDSFLKLFTNNKSQSIAEITVQQNDVKKKDSTSVDFRAVIDKERLFNGDSLATGTASAAMITFHSGQILSVDQNSLIVFDEYSDVPEFVAGNIKIVLKGKMKIKIDDEIVELDGKDKSAVQVYKDKKLKSKKVVLLSGQVKIKAKEKKDFIPLKINSPVEATKIILAKDILNGFETQKKEPNDVTATIIKRATSPEKEKFAYYKLYDVYSRLLSSNTELGKNNNFTENPNYGFEAFENTQIKIEALSQKITSEFDTQLFKLKIEDSVKADGYVFEISNDENFENQKTQILWRTSHFSHRFSEPGVYFLRYRKVLPGQILTNYSAIETVVVNKLEKPPLEKELAQQTIRKKVTKKEASRPLKIRKIVKFAHEKIENKNQEAKATERFPATKENPVQVPSESVVQSQSYSLSEWMSGFEFSFENKFNQFSAESDVSATKAKILTTRDLKLGLSLQKQLSTKWNSTYGIEVRNTKLTPTEGGLVQIDDRSNWIFGVKGTLYYESSDQLLTFFNLKLTQEIFLRSLGDSTIRSEDVLIPIVGSGFQYWTLANSKFNIGLENQFDYYLPSQSNQFNAESGYGFKSSLALRYLYDGRYLTAGVGYSYKNQGAGGVRQTESGALLYLNSKIPHSK